MKKTFVLDTNVLLYDAESIFKFQDNDIYIPLTVIDELDKFKNRQDETGRNARQFSRSIDKLRSKGSLVKGIKLDTGGTIYAYNDSKLFTSNKRMLNDDKILAVAATLREHKDIDTLILVSNDINMRIKADIMNVECESYGKIKKKRRERGFTGIKTITGLSTEVMDEFKENRQLHIAKLGEHAEDLYPNQYVILTSGGYKLKGRVKGEHIVPLIKDAMWGIRPKNCEQEFAFDALINDKIKLVTLVGKAGTGKTLVTIAAAFKKVLEDKRYSRILISRPIVPMGKDLGYLPGDINEKLAPWMQPIFDNIEFLYDGNSANGSSQPHEELINKKILKIEALTYIRGRSIPQQFMIIDEAQNLTPHEIKTIISRAGEGTKIVLTGDVDQIDNTYLDGSSNGLTHCVDNMKEEAIAAHITLTEGERSELSEIATKRL